MKGKTMTKIAKKVIENGGSVIYVDSKSDKQNKTIQLNPNSFKNADEVLEKMRELRKKGIKAVMTNQKREHFIYDDKKPVRQRNKNKRIQKEKSSKELKWVYWL